MGAGSNALRHIKSINFDETSGQFDIALRDERGKFPLNLLNLDRNSGLYFKVYEKWNGYTGMLSEQYEIMRNFYRISPEHVPRPIGKVTMGEEGRVVGYVMERIDGTTLKEFLSGTFTRDAAAAVAAQLRRFVEDIYNTGFSHEDFHHKNIMVSGSIAVKVIDPSARRLGAGDREKLENHLIELSAHYQGAELMAHYCMLERKDKAGSRVAASEF